jgi:hypothetical protein
MLDSLILKKERKLRCEVVEKLIIGRMLLIIVCFKVNLKVTGKSTL